MFIRAQLFSSHSPWREIQTRLRYCQRMGVELHGHQHTFRNIHGNTSMFDEAHIVLYHIMIFVLICPFGYFDCELTIQHAAGVAAMYLERNPSMTPAEVKAAMLSDGIPDVVTDPGDSSPNLLLTTSVFLSSSSSGTQSSASEQVAAPAPTPVYFAPTGPTTREINFFPVEEGCMALLEGCKMDSECCSGSCWLANYGLGFCAVPL